jgi:hypothetical protein
MWNDHRLAIRVQPVNLLCVKGAFQMAEVYRGEKKTGRRHVAPMSVRGGDRYLVIEVQAAGTPDGEAIEIRLDEAEELELLAVIAQRVQERFLEFHPEERRQGPIMAEPPTEFSGIKL